MKFKKYHFLIILVIFLSFWGIWTRSINVGGDLDYYFSGTIKDLISVPLTWREFFGGEGFGEYTVSTLWSWPLVFAVSFLNTLGFEYSLIIKIFFLIPIILLSSFSIKKLTDFYGISSWPQTISILFYSLNTYILLLIDGGQLGLALAYGLFPLAFVSLKNYIKVPALLKAVTAIFFILLLSFFDMRIILLLMLLMILDSFFEVFVRKRPKIILTYLKLGLIITIFLAGVYAYWLLPSLSFRLPQLPINYDRESQVGFLSFANITHSLFLIQPHWYENIFGKITPARAEFVFIPILVFLSAILRRKSIDVAFWLLVALISILLTKGSNEPLPYIYGWLFKNIPGFSIFRDPTKFFFPLVLSYTVLLGISSTEIVKRLSKFPKLKVIFGVLCIVYILFLARPIWLGKMTGLFSEPIYKKEYFRLNEILSKDANFSRVIWIPKKPSLGFVNSRHPAVDGLRLAQKRPFAVGTKGTYETINFLREAPYISELLNVSGIGYIGDPYLDPRRDDMHPDNIRYYSIFLNQLLKLPGISKVTDFPVPLLKLSAHQDRFFITPNTWWVIGSDNIYNEATKSGKLSLSKNALIFAEEQKGLGSKIDELPEVKIVLNNKSILDFSASFIQGQNLIFPASELNFQPDMSGWWKREATDLVSWRDFLQSKYGIDNQDFDLGGGWAIGEGNLELSVMNLELRKDRMLLARVLESTRSGELQFYQDDKLVGRINTKNEGNNVRWFEVGKLVSDETLTIHSQGGINVVNALASVEPSKWQDYQNKANDFKNKGRIKEFIPSNSNDLQTKISYKVVNSTKYKVTISDLKKPEMLIFSENYDFLWKLDNETPVPVFSFLNGFKITKDGEYTIEFEPQKYVLPGLLISGLTVAILLLFYLVCNYKK